MGAKDADSRATQTSAERPAPAHRAQVSKQRFETLLGPPVEPPIVPPIAPPIAPPIEAKDVRFKLRAPFAQTPDRSESFQEMAAQAEKLGSSRFSAIAIADKSTPIPKADGEQQPTPQLAALDEGYVIQRAPTVGPITGGLTEYRFRGDASRVAFTESTFRLTTNTNSPSVARSMVDVAQARNWQGIRVSGAKDYRRMVWLEASVRGVKALGYEPNPADLDLLRSERDATQVNRIEADVGSSPPSPVAKPVSRGGGRKAVMAAIEALLVAKHVPKAQRAAVLDAAGEQVAQRARAGQVPQVKIYDMSAPVQRPAMVHATEPARARGRAGPAHTR
ncbi:MAG: hypothetical protein JO006_16335 [Paucibacter sp.]|nr:hypothetical protein [Roseateles sp.]